MKPSRALLLGTTAGVAVSAGVTPMLTRLYNPADLGLLAVTSSVVTLFTVAANGGIETLIPRRLDDAVELLAVGVRKAVIVGLALAVLAAVVQLAEGPRFLALGRTGWAVSLGVFGVGYYGLGSTYSLARQRWSDVGVGRAAAAIITAVVQVAGSPFGSTSLLLGFSVGRIPVARWLLARTSTGGESVGHQKMPQTPLVQDVHTAQWRTAPGAILNGASTQLLPVALAATLGLKTAGVYAVVQKVLALPAATIGQTLAQTSVGEAARFEELHNWRMMLQRRQLLLVLGCLPVGAVLYVFGRPAFGAVFGDEWRTAGDMAFWVFPLYLGQLTHAPTSRLLPVLGRAETQLKWELGRLAASGAAMWAAVAMGSGYRAPLLAVGVVMACFYLVQSKMVYNRIDELAAG